MLVILVLGSYIYSILNTTSFANAASLILNTSPTSALYAFLVYPDR